MCESMRRNSDTLETTPLGEACLLSRFEDALRLIDLGADCTLRVRVPMFDQQPSEDAIPEPEREVGRHEEIDRQDSNPQPSIDTPLKRRISLLHICGMNFAKDCEAFKDLNKGVWMPGMQQASSRPKLIATVDWLRLATRRTRGGILAMVTRKLCSPSP